jgi:hypothetical protein
VTLRLAIFLSVPLLALTAIGCAQTQAPRPLDGAPAPSDGSSRRARPADRTPPADPDGGGVTITISVPRGQFANGADVNVSVMNRASIEAQKSAGSCMVGFSDGPVDIPCPDGFSCTTDPDRPNEVTICPPGVTPAAPPKVESFSFAQDAIDGSITFTARSLVQGEPFEIAIGGLAADGCNHVGASVSGLLEGSTLDLQPKNWSQTVMACN